MPLALINADATALASRLPYHRLPRAGRCLDLVPQRICRQRNEAANLHHWAVYALYVLFSAAALSMAWSLLRGEHRTAMRMRLLALIWILLGPIYYLWYPPPILGAVERVLALLMIGGHFALVAQALRHRAAAT
ncbi:hypothetical protein ABID21_003884 [Pseudorhizobium tarimense]|uniref:Uncharacterized protein n=1 Tax=Pseudorhizobium tarimense TaxID=1079109 RepID=A0ABV2HB33_9HYPH|nr:hypothetical protein [Pseudorhizobium tarimense]MCJ8520669.1 hypothetical protein [Pseudorhizobium tarimense]